MSRGPPPWDAIDTCVGGAWLLKFGRRGEPHFRHFSLDAACETLSWHSEKKKTSEAAMRVRDCDLRLGQHTAVFKRYAARGVVFEGMSFSLESRGVGGRTLDVACKDKGEFEAWTSALRYLLGGPPLPGELAGRVAAAPSLEQQARRRAKSRDVARDLKSARVKEVFDVYAWGDASWGQTGHGSQSGSDAPRVSGALLGKSIRSVSCGYDHSVALTSHGEVYVWGNGGCGRLGTGGTGHELLPRPLLQPMTTDKPLVFASVSCGDMHTLAIDDGGDVLSFGRGRAAGHGSDDDVLTPTRLAAGAFDARVRAGWPPGAAARAGRAVAVAAGGEHSAVLFDGGLVATWGAGDHGALGTGGLFDAPVPGLVTALLPCVVSRVACGACRRHRARARVDLSWLPLA